MNPRIREAARELIVKFSKVIESPRDIHGLPSMVYEAMEREVEKLLSSHIALAERRGGERVRDAVCAALVQYSPTIGNHALDGIASAARSALDEMGKEV